MITIYDDIEQGSDEWLELRRGILTASEMKLIITPTLKAADNDKSRMHLYELLAQRISGFVEASYISDDMLRGQHDEIEARALYAKHYAPVREVGFVTNDEWGFPIGYSPDGLVGDDGLIECKSRRQKYLIQTIVDYQAAAAPVPDYLIQCQTGMLVTGRKWCDLVSYCGGLPLSVIRIEADAEIQEKIISAAIAFDSAMAEKQAIYQAEIAKRRMIQTERIIEQEMFI